MAIFKPEKTKPIVPVKPEIVPLREKAPETKPRIAQPSTPRPKNPPKDRMMGCRFELKYLIRPSLVNPIRRYISDYIELDPYSRVQQDGFYTIGTLYLEAHNLQLYRANMEGHKNRFKLRIRTYDDSRESPCFLEIKRKVDAVILKSRAALKKKNITRTLSCCSPHYINSRKDKKVINQFQLYKHSINANPVIQVRYKRSAYESSCNMRVRVTIDRNLCFRTVNKPKIGLNSRGWQNLRLGGVILEIKFTDRFPKWLNRMVQIFNLKQRPISKYAYSIQQAGLLKFCAPQMPIRF